MTEQGGIDMGLGKMYAQGGVDMEKQMDLFNDKTELRDEGGEKDNASGNDVPLGGDKEGVRDDQEANISVGEMVIPADVVRYHGVEKFMALRDEAKMGFKKMDAMGQLGNSEEAVLPDDTMFNPGGAPFSIVDMEVIESEDDDLDAADGALIMAANGAVAAPTGNIQQIQTDPLTGQPIVTTAEQEVAQEANELTTGVTGQTAQTAQQQPITPAAPVTQVAAPAVQATTQGTLPQFTSFFGGAGKTFRHRDGRVIVLPEGTPPPEGFAPADPITGTPIRRTQPITAPGVLGPAEETPEQRLARQRREEEEELRASIDPSRVDEPSTAIEQASISLGNTDLTFNDFDSVLESGELTLGDLENQLATEVQAANAAKAFEESPVGKALGSTMAVRVGKFLNNAVNKLTGKKTAQEKYDAFRENYVKPRFAETGKGRGYVPTETEKDKIKAEADKIKATQQAFEEGLGKDYGFDYGLGDVAQAEAAAPALGFDPQAALGFGRGAAKGALIKADKGGLMKKNKRKKKSYRRGGLATPKK